jgi:hypothetical protein
MMARPLSCGSIVAVVGRGVEEGGAGKARRGEAEVLTGACVLR